jgi:hypothetical protein
MAEVTSANLIEPESASIVDGAVERHFVPVHEMHKIDKNRHAEKIPIFPAITILGGF